VAIFNRASGNEIAVVEPLLTTFGVGTYPIGEHRFGMKGIVRGIYRVEFESRGSYDANTSHYIRWALHNSPNPAFDQVISGGNYTPFLVPVANARFFSVKSEGGIWTLAEAYDA